MCIVGFGVFLQGIPWWDTEAGMGPGVLSQRVPGRSARQSATLRAMWDGICTVAGVGVYLWGTVGAC